MPFNVEELNTDLVLKEIRDLDKEGSTGAYKRIEYYENGYYTLKINFYREDEEIIGALIPKPSAERENDKFPLPTIYSDDFKENIEFEVQTTAYGTLTPPEIENLVVGYQIALKTIESAMKIVPIRE